MCGDMLYGINLNGDVEFSKLHDLCRIADNYDYIFVGENIRFKHSFTILPFIAENTEKARIATGIISPLINMCFQIKQSFRTLLELYGRRFSIALAMGDVYGLNYLGIEPKNVIEKIKSCVEEIKVYKWTKDVEIFIGASAPKMIGEASKIADGVLLNYASPEFIGWAKGFLDRKTKIGCYAPALAECSDENLKKLLYASAVIIRGANKDFLEEFGIKKIADEIKNDITKVFKYKDFLLENFTIGKNVDEIVDRVREYKKIGVDMCIFASPIYYSHNGIKRLVEALGLCS